MVTDRHDCDVLKLVAEYFRPDERDTLYFNAMLTALPIRSLVCVLFREEFETVGVLTFMVRTHKFEVWFSSVKKAEDCLQMIRNHIRLASEPPEGCKGYVDGMIEGMDKVVTIPVWAITHAGQISSQRTPSFVEFDVHIDTSEDGGKVVFAVSYDGPFPICSTQDEALGKCNEMLKTVNIELLNRC